MRSEVRRLLRQLDIDVRECDEDGWSEEEPPVLEADWPYLTRLSKAGQSPQLHDFQRDLVDSIVDTARAGSSALLSLPTGGGKTRTAAVGLIDFLRESPSSSALWLAPSIELLQQAAVSIRDVWEHTGYARDVQLAYRGEQPPDPSVWFSTPQAIYARGRPLSYPVDLVVFDEAHQVQAPTFRRAVELARFVGARPAGLVGLSATPGRAIPGETEDLVAIFEGRLLTSARLGRDPVRALQRRGILAQLRFHVIALAPARDRPQERLRVAIRTAHRLAQRGGRILVFSASVDHAIATACALRARGVPADFVDGALNPQERQSRLERFGTGRTSVLSNQKLLTTGYDCPAVDHVIIEEQVGSPVLFEQMVGRAARGPGNGGTAIAHIWQFDDHLELHGLPKSYYRFRDFAWSDAGGDG